MFHYFEILVVCGAVFLFYLQPDSAPALTDSASHNFFKAGTDSDNDLIASGANSDENKSSTFEIIKNGAANLLIKIFVDCDFCSFFSLVFALELSSAS